jgi:hypothetical protein
MLVAGRTPWHTSQRTMSSAKIGVAVLVLCVTGVGAVRAQPVHQPTTAELTELAADSNSRPHWFQLELPLVWHPLTVSWTTTPAPTYELMRWATYDWEARIWRKGPVDLFAFNRVRPAIELDCLAFTCRPKLESTYGTESRLHLGGKGAMPDNYLFMRFERVIAPVHGFSRMKFGIGGLLDL